MKAERPGAARRSPLGGPSGGLPRWLIPRAPKGPQLAELGKALSDAGVHTICQTARCPNVGECFGRGCAAFLILGEACTRDCRFCAVGHGRPEAPDPEEPLRVAAAAARLGLRHVTVTSVTRDDLPDGGAAHFAATVRAVRMQLPGATVEVLVPDFLGDRGALRAVLAARPDVLNHNVETAPRLYCDVRPQANYGRSVRLLARASEMAPGTLTKSGLMVGLGERREEVVAVLRDLRRAGVGAVTLGQYLRPTLRHLPVAEYVDPETFVWYETAARGMGFGHVLSGPLVRSSYHAEEFARG